MGVVVKNPSGLSMIAKKDGAARRRFLHTFINYLLHTFSENFVLMSSQVTGQVAIPDQVTLPPKNLVIQSGYSFGRTL